jgi:hypothetical protein
VHCFLLEDIVLGDSGVSDDLEKLMSGGKSIEVGHSSPKICRIWKFCLKYEQILMKFRFLSGGLCPHSALLGSAPEFMAAVETRAASLSYHTMTTGWSPILDAKDWHQLTARRKRCVAATSFRGLSPMIRRRRLAPAFSQVAMPRRGCWWSPAQFILLQRCGRGT